MKLNLYTVHKLFIKSLIVSVLLAGSLVRVASAELVTFNLFGDLGNSGPTGDTGLEQGTFSGTFTYDPAALDQLPLDPSLGIYNLEHWSLDFFDASDVFAGQINASDGGDAIILVGAYPEGGFIGMDFSSPSSIFFGQSFNVGLLLESAIVPMSTDALPNDLSGVSFVNGGLILGDLPVITFVDEATITPIPIPAALFLLGSGLLVFVGLVRR